MLRFYFYLLPLLVLIQLHTPFCQFRFVMRILFTEDPLKIIYTLVFYLLPG